MIGYAKMFHAAGISWTTSTYCNEGGNFGLFLNYANLKKINNRILEAARQLKVKKDLLGGVRTRLEGRSGLHHHPERSPWTFWRFPIRRISAT